METLLISNCSHLDSFPLCIAGVLQSRERFIATRMRALQMTQNKGAPQGWVQDGMSAEREMKGLKSSVAVIPVTIEKLNGHRIDSCSCCRLFQCSSTGSCI